MATPFPASVAGPRSRIRIRVRGAVQGVGFRPFIYRRAAALGLAGWVSNGADGVTVEAEGAADRLAVLVGVIRQMPPPNAAVVGIETQEMVPWGEAGFAIRESEAVGTRSTQVLPDLATCEAFLSELFDPRDRRYLYPFINCTRCGPRYSIVEDLPYDRARTSMRHFAMCAACRAEYDDPADRRFHAEPIACPDCGPRLALWEKAGAVLARETEATAAAASAIRAGRIVAVKGIGGFHLFVDARNEAAVRRLRAAKRRQEKPFAIMFPTLTDVRHSCRLTAAEADLLAGPARPIVLARRTGGPLAPSVAPRNARLGALLPYAPLHHLLMRDLGFPVVATSGNVSDEPIVTDEVEARLRLGDIADLFLVHDRKIVRALDDSVAHVVCGEPQLLRRARGYAPTSVAAAGVADGIRAFGGHLNSPLKKTELMKHRA